MSSYQNESKISIQFLNYASFRFPNVQTVGKMFVLIDFERK